jgi:hypothetical protein
MISAVLLLLMADAPVTATTASSEISEPDPKRMTSAEIRAFNAKLPRDHPYYIRCVRIETTGSLVPSRRASCRTNASWVAADAAGNREARDVADAMRGKAVDGSH